MELHKDITQITTWYHGTSSMFLKDLNDHVLATKSKKYRDFGQGFYLTDDKIKALNWAKRRTKVIKQLDPNNKSLPLLVECSVNIEKIKTNFHIKAFGADFTADLLEYLIFNRINHGENNKFPTYDTVIGLIADGAKLDKTLTDYQQGVIQFNQAKEQIEYDEKQIQLCIKNQEILDNTSLFKVKTLQKSTRR